MKYKIEVRVTDNNGKGRIGWFKLDSKLNSTDLCKKFTDVLHKGWYF